MSRIIYKNSRIIVTSDINDPIVIMPIVKTADVGMMVDNYRAEVIGQAKLVLNQVVPGPLLEYINIDKDLNDTVLVLLVMNMIYEKFGNFMVSKSILNENEELKYVFNEILHCPEVKEGYKFTKNAYLIVEKVKISIQK